jgi:phosphoserine phosphatase RsbU/P
LLTSVMKKYSFLNAIHIRLDSVIPDNKNYCISRIGSELLFEAKDNLIYSCQPEKEVYRKITGLREKGWTDPFICDEHGNMVVAFYCPIKVTVDNSQQIFAGQVISELSLYELNNSINNIKIGERGYAFILNRNGDYITYPRKEYILKRNIFNLPPGILDTLKVDVKSIFSGNKAGSFWANPDFLDYDKSWVYYTPINQNKWILFFVMPRNELYGELYLLTSGMFIIALLGIIVIVLIIRFISNKLIEPLSAVTSQLNIFSNPENHGIPDTKDEIKQVSDSLNYLKERFEQYHRQRDLEETKSFRRQQDLIAASEIQRSFIKTDFNGSGKNKNIDLYALYKPASVISGDMFDYFYIDDDHLGFTIGDVSGMGVPAALFMSIAQTTVKNNAVGLKAKDIVSKVNKDLCTSSQHQFFLTLFLGVLNIRKGELNYCNAAHTTALILKTNGTVVELNKFHGLPLGLYPEREYHESQIKLDKGDSVILYTDGVTELENGNKVQFGINRLKVLLPEISIAGTNTKSMVLHIEKELEKYRGETPQNDDICIFIIKYKPARKPEPLISF